MIETVTTEPVSGNETIDAKWGAALSAGFVAVPNVLIKHQRKLNLTQNELTVIMNLLLHWWYKDKMPFPSTRNIAERSGLEVRTIQRALQSLQSKKMIAKVQQDDKLVFNLEGLRTQLEAYAKTDLWSITKIAQSSNVVEMESTPELT